MRTIATKMWLPFLPSIHPFRRTFFRLFKLALVCKTFQLTPETTFTQCLTLNCEPFRLVQMALTQTWAADWHGQ